MPSETQNDGIAVRPDPDRATGNDLIDRLPAGARLAATEELARVRLEAGEMLATPELIQSTVYFPVDSVVSEYRILKDGKTIEVAMTGGEGVVGIHTVFDPQPSPHFAQTLVAGSAYRADAGRFRKVVKANPALRDALFDFQNAHTAQISRNVVCSNFHTTEERICLWLKMVHDRTGLTELEFTQEQIGKHLGVYRPSVTVALQSLNDQGLISQERGRVCLREPEAIGQSACGCYAELRIERSFR